MKFKGTIENGEDTSVQVAVRVRPISSNENQNGDETSVEVLSDTSLKIPSRQKQFTFDSIYGHDSTQAEIYETSVAPLVTNFFNGYNATVLAYGQTGSGKTYTMGTSSDNLSNNEEFGVIPRAMNTIFTLIEEKKEEVPAAEFYLRVQFLELYGEEIRDLLKGSGNEASLGIRESPLGGVSVIGATEETVASAEDMFSALERGSLCRTTGSTNMNLHSSRSHAIFTITIEQHLPRIEENSESKVEDETEYRTAKFHFVDLAGSERAKKTGAKGKRLREGININMGLLALGNVISALGTQDEGAKVPVHVPYRSSKLTRLLQDSLGGNSKTLMIACASPSSYSIEETINTLRYANRAKNIKNKPIVNTDPASSQISLLKKEIQKLKQQVLSNGTYSTDADLERQLIKVTDALNDEKSARSEIREKYLVISAERDNYLNILKQNNLISNDNDVENIIKEKDRVLKLEEEVKVYKKKLRKLRQNYDVSDGEESDEEDGNCEKVLEDMKKELREFEETKENILIDAAANNLSVDEVEEVALTSEETDPETLQLHEKYLKSQKNLTTLVNNYDASLKQKEEIMKQIIDEKKKFRNMKDGYEQKLQALHAEVEITRRHRKELNQKIKQLEEKTTTKNFSEKDMTKYKGQLETLRQAIRNKDDKLRSLEIAAKKLKEAKKQEEKMLRKEKKICREIDDMKRQKVVFQRQMEENSKRYREELLHRKREIAQLKKRQLTLEKKNSKCEMKTKRDEQMLKVKTEKLVAIQRKYRNAQKMQRQPSKKEVEQIIARKMHTRDVRERLKLKDELEQTRLRLKKKEAAIQRLKLIGNKVRECGNGLRTKQTDEEKQENEIAEENTVKVKEYEDLQKLLQRAKAEVDFRLEQEESHKGVVTDDKETASEDSTPEDEIVDVLETFPDAIKACKQLLRSNKNKDRQLEKLRVESGILKNILSTLSSQGQTTGNRRKSTMQHIEQLEEKVVRLQFKEAKWENKTVFDRLTSVDHFTGIHKRRALDHRIEKVKTHSPAPPTPVRSVRPTIQEVDIIEETQRKSQTHDKFSLREHMLQEKLKRKQIKIDE